MLTINVKQCIFIDLPAREIFAYLSNLENLVDWSSIVVTLTQASPGTMQVGATFQGTVHFLSKSLALTLEIVEYEAGRYLAIKSTSSVSPCLCCYQLEPAEGGGTSLSQEMTIQHAEGFVELALPIIKGAVRRQLEYDLFTLKEMLEARIPTSRQAT